MPMGSTALKWLLLATVEGNPAHTHNLVYFQYIDLLERGKKCLQSFYKNAITIKKTDLKFSKEENSQ